MMWESMTEKSQIGEFLSEKFEMKASIFFLLKE